MGKTDEALLGKFPIEDQDDCHNHESENMCVGWICNDSVAF